MHQGMQIQARMLQPKQLKINGTIFPFLHTVTFYMPYILVCIQQSKPPAPDSALFNSLRPTPQCFDADKPLSLELVSESKEERSDLLSLCYPVVWSVDAWHG